MNDNNKIRIARPCITNDQIQLVSNVLLSGKLAQGDLVTEFEDRFATYIGSKYAVAVSSGTAGLYLSLLALGIGEGDEVITTDFSFVGTASPILMVKGNVVFVDIDRKTYNIDMDAVERVISSKTRAIIPVHLYGQPCDINRLLAIADPRGIPIIEDACQAHGAEYSERRVGSLGVLGVFSFYATKNMTTGEGGMITTDDGDIAEQLRLLRNHGQSQRYLHKILGHNFRMTEFQAALGIVQLNRLDSMNERRRTIARYYRQHLNIPAPFEDPYCKHVYHQYTLRNNHRDDLLHHLDARGIEYGIYYPIPIHQQPLFQELGFGGFSFVSSEKAAQEVVSIPVHPMLTDSEVEWVVQVVNEYVDLQARKRR